MSHHKPKNLEFDFLSMPQSIDFFRKSVLGVHKKNVDW